MTWNPISAPPGTLPPAPITVRAQHIPPRHYFPEHAHQWNQLVYAYSGVLTVNTDRDAFVISPAQAVWLPHGTPHHVGSLLGAEFRSLWIAKEFGNSLPETSTVFHVELLLQALICEAAIIENDVDVDGYANRVATLILDQLRRARILPTALPWPRDERLLKICEHIYLDPAETCSPEEWGQRLKMSSRTLARRFEADMGMSLCSWRRRVRLFRSIELLGGGLGVTQVAMELGYSSSSAFIYAFRTEMGASPQAYMRKRTDVPRQHQ